MNLLLIAYAQKLPADDSSGVRGIYFDPSFFHSVCKRAANALVKLCICPYLIDHSLLANAISINILCAG